VRIAIATCKHPPVHDDDLDFLLPALRRRGADAEAVVWNDPKADWSSFDLVLVSSTWDYDEDLDAFRAWARRTGKATQLQNPAATIEWNVDKRYLRELEEAGVPIVPTIWTEPGGEDEIERTVAELGWNDVVLKPVVDLGARRLVRVETEMVARLLRAIDAPAMAQPFLPALQSEGELSLVYLGGELSHAVRKIPAPGDFRVQPQYGGSVEPVRPTAAAIELAEAALAAAPGEPLYARADMIRDERGDLRLIELELIEPVLFLGRHADAGEALGRAVLAAAS
jgi:glutathione synthase/RimK-type ligase-like ATP-grasp enzyme